MILLVNQHAVPIFIDIANAFANTDNRTILFSGYIEQGGKPLSEKVKWVRSAPYNRKTTFSRIFSWTAFAVHYFFFLCRHKPSAILVVTNPPLAPFVSALIAGVRSIPYYILIYDLYPDALVQAGMLQNNNLIFRLWKKINPWVLKKATLIITLSDSMREAVMAYLPDQSDKIKVIHNWADTSYIRPMAKSENAFIKRYHLQGKKIILYSGNMGLTHDLESLIGAAEILQDQKDVIFLLIGDGGKKKLLENMASGKKLTNVLFLPYQDAINFPMAMAAADIGIVTLGAGAEGISVPSKAYVNLAAGICIVAIAPESSELSRLIATHRAGVICEPGDPRKVADALFKLLSDESLLDEYKQNALKASSFYTSENAFRYVREIMEPHPRSA